MLRDVTLMFVSMALAGVLSEPPAYLPPNIPQGSYSTGPDANSTLFGQKRGPSGATSNRFADPGPPSTQYGNPIAPQSRFASNRNQQSLQYIPPSNSNVQRKGFKGQNYARRISGGRTPSNVYNQPGVQYANPSGPSNQFIPPSTRPGVTNGPSPQYGTPRGINRQNNANLQSQHGALSGRPKSSYALAAAGLLGNVAPIQYSIPFPTLAPNTDAAKHNAAVSRTYVTPDTAISPASNRFIGPQRPDSRYAVPRGQHSPRIPSPLYNAPAPVYGPSTNAHMQDDMSEPVNYEFRYEVQDAESGNDFGHMESRQDDDTKGTYYVLLPDGRKQIVEYKANPDGYKPMVRYEGTANSGLLSGEQNQSGPY